MTNTVKRPDGIELVLPDVNVSNSWSCSHHVAIDGSPMDTLTAIRYLIADRERITTLLADARAKIDELLKTEGP